MILIVFCTFISLILCKYCAFSIQFPKFFLLKNCIITFMENNYKIYLICYCNGRPIDFLLPVYTDSQFADVAEVAGTCFKIREPKGAEILLACRKDNNIATTRINIESVCKTDTYISFSIVVDEAKETVFLRAFTDNQHNAFYPIPKEFISQASTLPC